MNYKTKFKNRFTVDDLCIFLLQIIRILFRIFEFTFVKLFDFLFIKLYLIQCPINNKILNHNIVLINKKYKFSYIMQDFKSNFICQKCNCKLSVRPSYNKNTGNGWHYYYVINNRDFNLDLTCDEYIIKNLLE